MRKALEHCLSLLGLSGYYRHAGGNKGDLLETAMMMALFLAPPPPVSGQGDESLFEILGLLETRGRMKAIVSSDARDASESDQTRLWVDEMQNMFVAISNT